MLLTVIWVCVICIGAWFLISQVLTPALFGGRLFPMFRQDPLHEKVIAAREQVADLKDAVALTAQLKVLKEQSAELERQLSEIAASASTPNESTSKEGEQPNV
jgi:hypothetical protein